MSFNGQPLQGQNGNFTFSSGRGGNSSASNSSQFMFNGMPQNFAGFDPSQFNMQMNAAMAAQQQAAQFYDQYGEEVEDEEGEQLDENGDPVPSPEEVRQIINSINSFKYEEAKAPAGGSDKKPSDTQSERGRESCAICLDDMKTGQMVKALRCSHKFHEKCINNWLKQKLLCPLCKEKVTLNQQ